MSETTTDDTITPRSAAHWWGLVVGVAWREHEGQRVLEYVWTRRHLSAERQHDGREWELLEWECMASKSWETIFYGSGSGNDTRHVSDGRFQLRVDGSELSIVSLLWMDYNYLVPALPYVDEATAPVYQPNPRWVARPAWRDAYRDELDHIKVIIDDPGDVLANLTHSEGTPVECEICKDVFPDENESVCRHVFWASGGDGWTGPGHYDYADDAPRIQAAVVAAATALQSDERVVRDIRQLAVPALSHSESRYLRDTISRAISYLDDSKDDEHTFEIAQSAVQAMGWETPEYDAEVVAWLLTGCGDVAALDT